MHSPKPRQLASMLSCGLVRNLVHEAATFEPQVTLAQVSMPAALIPTLRRACLVRLADDLERMLVDPTRNPVAILMVANYRMRKIRGGAA